MYVPAGRAGVRAESASRLEGCPACCAMPRPQSSAHICELYQLMVCTSVCTQHLGRPPSTRKELRAPLPCRPLQYARRKSAVKWEHGAWDHGRRSVLRFQQEFLLWPWAGRGLGSCRVLANGKQTAAEIWNERHNVVVGSVAKVTLGRETLNLPHSFVQLEFQHQTVCHTQTAQSLCRTAIIPHIESDCYGKRRVCLRNRETFLAFPK